MNQNATGNVFKVVRNAFLEYHGSHFTEPDCMELLQLHYLAVVVKDAFAYLLENSEPEVRAEYFEALLDSMEAKHE